ncbi:MAG: hypothetical protein ACI4BA_06285 [Prevotella sp.]
MKKKEYIIPEILVVELGNSEILAGSDPMTTTLGIDDEIDEDNKGQFEW